MQYTTRKDKAENDFRIGKMENSDGIDLNKRRSLKVITAVTATGLVSAMPAIGDDTWTRENIDCSLILRADGRRLHLLMSNKSLNSITVSRFTSQPVLIGKSVLDLAKAFIEPIDIPSMDRVMVRLSIEAGLQSTVLPTAAKGRAGLADAETRYLPQGTRVVDFTAFVRHKVGSVDTRSAPVNIT